MSRFPFFFPYDTPSTVFSATACCILFICFVSFGMVGGYEITKRDRVTVWPFRFATFRLSQPREAAGLRQGLDLLPCSICSRDQLDPLSYLFMNRIIILLSILIPFF